MKSIQLYSRSLVVLIFILFNFFIWSATLAATDRVGVLTVAFLDVGQGDAIYIEAPNGNQMLVDGGSNTGVLRELSQVMPWGDRSIDVVLATHPDKDHIAGLIEVLSRYEVSQYLHSGVFNDTAVYEELQKTVSRSNVTAALARRGQRVVLDEVSGVYADILFPDRDVAHLETNSGSVIIRIVYGETEFMLTGDAQKTIERYLVYLNSRSLESDVLKAGHHGSKTSSDESFVRAVSPQVAVISAGEDNRYGHPHKEVIGLFNALGIETVNTADVGTILFESDGFSVTKR
ncbi:MAG: MBL fold metallo-hydrolase [Candidatus Pacebacteria bacterium]|nr:MBL fold metallo-hydrolase [Candidatus Paceibacterota bacterium]